MHVCNSIANTKQLMLICDCDHKAAIADLWLRPQSSYFWSVIATTKQLLLICGWDHKADIAVRWMFKHKNNIFLSILFIKIIFFFGGFLEIPSEQIGHFQKVDHLLASKQPKLSKNNELTNKLYFPKIGIECESI